jgi:GDP-4-dehydro-6-deoxy-D-mannose reductase
VGVPARYIFRTPNHDFRVAGDVSVKSAFITGVNGFVGAHLCAHLASKGYAVSGVDTAESASVSGISYANVDIRDPEGLAEQIERAGPGEVYHLAGVSFPPDADLSPRNALEVNMLGAIGLLDAVRRAKPDAVTLLVGSSKEYSAGDDGEPVDESQPLSPTSFYGISKYAAELIGLQYVRQFGLDVRFSRSFNHTGPGQSPRFVCSDWARQVARIDAGASEARVEVGDLSPHIDFTDVRDVVAAYHAIVTRGGSGVVYNVCSGKAVSLEYVLSYLLKKTGRTVGVVRAETKVRGHATSSRLVGNNGRLVRETGWHPQVPLESTLDDLFAFWAERTGKERSRADGG